MTGDSMKMLMLTLPFMVRDLITPEVRYDLVCLWFIHCYVMYIHVCTRFYSSTGLLMPLKPAQVCTNCLTLLIPVTRLWRYSFSAWIGISRLASREFQSQRCLNCSRKRSIFLTSCRKTSLTRPGKRPIGSLKRHTALCTRSAELRCGEIRIARRVKHHRYVVLLVCTLFMSLCRMCIQEYNSTYTYVLCTYTGMIHTSMYLSVLIVNFYASQHAHIETSKLWAT